MKEVQLITLGKLGDSNLESLEKDYLKRITSPKIKIHETDDLEKKLNELGPGFIVLLTERGLLHKNSIEFSKWFYDLLEKKSGKLKLVIGGAAGFDDKVLEMADAELSLSALTFPHKIARLLLVEQIYRAQTIRSGHPYHK